MEPKKGEFKHYGIPGMKWGVRRSEDQLRRAAKRRGDSRDWDTGGSDSGSSDSGSSGSRGSTRDVSEMSDTELRQRINRIQMERQYNQLTSSGPSRSLTSRGAGVATQILGNAAKNIATQQLTKRGNALVDDVINR